MRFLRERVGRQVHAFIDSRIAIQQEAVIQEAFDRVRNAQLREPRTFGPPERLSVAETAKVNDALFNTVSGNIEVGEGAFFGHDVLVLTGTHDLAFTGVERQAAVPAEGRDVIIGSGVWISSRATILGPCRIGKNAVVAAGAVVTHDVSPFEVVAGVPAKPIRSAAGPSRSIDVTPCAGGVLPQPVCRYHEPAMNREEIQRRVNQVPYWWHSIDVGSGVITPGSKWGGGQDVMEYERARMRIPDDFDGCTVLDIGSYDGYYAFDAERRGAERVVALDHFVWLQDLRPGGPPVDFSLQYLKPDGLPPTGVALLGKRAFDTAHGLIDSKVESLVADFMHYDLDLLGVFDIVLYLGIVYHMEEPLTALRRVRRVTRQKAIIESEVVHVPGLDAVALANFAPGSEFNQDPTNYWVPNMRGLAGLARAAGFSRVEVVDGPTDPHSTTSDGLECYRATVHAYV